MSRSNCTHSFHLRGIFSLVSRGSLWSSKKLGDYEAEFFLQARSLFWHPVNTECTQWWLTGVVKAVCCIYSAHFVICYVVVLDLLRHELVEWISYSSEYYVQASCIRGFTEHDSINHRQLMSVLRTLRDVSMLLCTPDTRWHSNWWTTRSR